MSDYNKLEKGLAEASEKFNSLPSWLKTKEPIEGSTRKLESNNSDSNNVKKSGNSQ